MNHAILGLTPCKDYEQHAAESAASIPHSICFSCTNAEIETLHSISVPCAVWVGDSEIEMTGRGTEHIRVKLRYHSFVYRVDRLFIVHWLRLEIQVHAAPLPRSPLHVHIRL